MAESERQFAVFGASAGMLAVTEKVGLGIRENLVISVP
jgi:hypothetical protein